jgi:hypothetical protein
MTGFLPIERSVVYSPVWIVPFDEHNQRVRSTGVTALLDRWDDDENAWLPLDVASVRTPSGAIVYPGLGRRGGPEPRRHRVRLSAFGYQALYPADGEPFSVDTVGIEFLTYPYSEVQPPAAQAEARLVRLLPSTAFPYPPGVRTVYGVVVDGATRAPVPNALVEAQGATSPDGVEWLERTLSDTRGAFRLALRWEGERTAPDPTETFRLRATQRPGRTGELVIRLPENRDRQQVIEIVEQ